MRDMSTVGGRAMVVCVGICLPVDIGPVGRKVGIGAIFNIGVAVARSGEDGAINVCGTFTVCRGEAGSAVPTGRNTGIGAIGGACTVCLTGEAGNPVCLIGLTGRNTGIDAIGGACAVCLTGEAGKTVCCRIGLTGLNIGAGAMGGACTVCLTGETGRVGDLWNIGVYWVGLLITTVPV